MGHYDECRATLGEDAPRVPGLLEQASARVEADAVQIANMADALDRIGDELGLTHIPTQGADEDNTEKLPDGLFGKLMAAVAQLRYARRRFEQALERMEQVTR